MTAPMTANEDAKYLIEADAAGRVCVLGAGVIGRSWAAYLVANGIDVAVYDARSDIEAEVREFVDRAFGMIERATSGRGVRSRGALEVHRSLEYALHESAMIIECVVERLETKRALFAECDAIVDQNVIIASSTSGLLMSDIQSFCRHPARCVTTHPFNPPHLIPLVEIAGGRMTSPRALDATAAFLTRIGKRVVRLRHEISGCIANRLARAVWREAVSLLEREVAGVGEIDDAMRFGPGLRWAIQGPYLTYHLAGGDGGIEQFFSQFGPRLQSSWADLGSPVLTPALQEKISSAVRHHVGTSTVPALEAARDEALVRMLQAMRSEHEV